MISISVIIPVFNKENFVERSIISVLNQTYTNFELLIINDGSTDKSVDKINKFTKDTRVTLINQENKGVSASRNIGIKIAKGEYITFLDADDEWNALFLEKMFMGIKDNEVCYCGHRIQEGSKTYLARINYTNKDNLKKYLKNISTPHTNSWLIRKDYLLENNLFFDENLSYGEDMLFFASVLAKNKKISYVSEALTTYHLSIKDSLSSVSLNNVYKEIQWIEDLKEVIKNTIYSEKEKKDVINVINGYRLPGTLINTLYLNYDKNNFTQQHKDAYLFSRPFIKELNFSNGLRSIKLYYYGFLVRLLYTKEIRKMNK